MTADLEQDYADAEAIFLAMHPALMYEVSTFGILEFDEDEQENA